MYDDTPPDTPRAPIGDTVPATQVPAKPAGHRTIPLEFTGNAREYFGIWIVNVFLTLLTLGIYTAWAKVRTKRYFYNNTLFDRTPFDYLANPIAILKGWLIAMVVMLCYTVLTHFYPRAQMFFGPLFFILLPVLVVRALRFRLRNTAYRNVRFNFSGTYRDAIRVFIGVGIWVGVTLGIMYPYFKFREKKFLVENTGFGIRNFSFKAHKSDFYSIYTLASVWVVVLLVLGFVVTQISTVGTVSAPPPEVNDHGAGNTLAWHPPMLLLVGIAVGVFAIIAYLDTALTNLVLNKTEMRGIRIHSSLKIVPMMILYFTNLAAIAVSFGLLIPWARVRMTRYRITNITVLVRGDLDSFIAREVDAEQATGDELSDVFNVDIGV